MKSIALILFLFAVSFPNSVSPQESSSFSIKAPKVVLTGINFQIAIKPSLVYYLNNSGEHVSYIITDMESKERLSSGSYYINPENPIAIEDSIIISRSGRTNIQISLGTQIQNISIRVIPAILSIVPPLLAILLALITRQVIVALFSGIWIGVTFIYDYNLLSGFLHTADQYIIAPLKSSENVSILIFTLVLGGMVGVISRSGGTQGIVDYLSRFANDSRRGQLATWAMGIFIFFDDYANTLIVGNTMRPLTDKLKISREKLSYLVDSTAAPVANIAIISTWIGYELGDRFLY